MKILFLHRNLPPDSFTGVAVQVHRLANALCELGNEVVIITQSRKPLQAKYSVKPFKNSGLRISLLFFPFFKRILYPFWFRYIDVKGFDVVHIHGDGAFIKYQDNFIRTFYGTAALEFQHSKNIKGKIAQGLSFLMEKKEARNCRLKVGISPHVASFLPGVDKIIPCMLSENTVKQFPIKSLFPSIIYIGSRFSRKRGETALDLYLKLIVRYPTLKFTYVTSKAEATLLENIPLYANINFKSKISQEEIDSLYNESWISLCLSSYEGFGLSIIEGMAAGCVVVSTPHQGSEFLLTHKKNGILSSIESISKAIEEIIDNDSFRNAIAHEAFENSKNFLAEIVAEKYLELYRIAKVRTKGLSQ